MPRTTRQQAMDRKVVDALARLLMKHETYAMVCRSRNLASQEDRHAAKLAAETAARIVLKAMLGRQPTPQEIEDAIWG